VAIVQSGLDTGEKIPSKQRKYRRNSKGAQPISPAGSKGRSAAKKRVSVIKGAGSMSANKPYTSFFNPLIDKTFELQKLGANKISSNTEIIKKWDSLKD
jgi:hypothetical protein